MTKIPSPTGESGSVPEKVRIPKLRLHFRGCPAGPSSKTTDAACTCDGRMAGHEHRCANPTGLCEMRGYCECYCGYRRAHNGNWADPTMTNSLLPDGEPEKDRVRLSNVCYVLLGTRDPEKVRDWINAAYAAESRAASSPSSLGSPPQEMRSIECCATCGEPKNNPNQQAGEEVTNGWPSCANPSCVAFGQPTANAWYRQAPSGSPPELKKLLDDLIFAASGGISSQSPSSSPHVNTALAQAAIEDFFASLSLEAIDAARRISQSRGEK